jgi:hypothetical protein
MANDTFVRKYGMILTVWSTVVTVDAIWLNVNKLHSVRKPYTYVFYDSQNTQQLFRRNQQLHTFILDCFLCCRKRSFNISYIRVLKRFRWRANKLNLTVSVYHPVFVMQIKNWNWKERLTAESSYVMLPEVLLVNKCMLRMFSLFLKLLFLLYCDSSIRSLTIKHCLAYEWWYIYHNLISQRIDQVWPTLTHRKTT